MILLSFALAYIAMTLLCLTMSRHRRELWRAHIPLPGNLVMRLLATACLAFALWLCVNSLGGEVGTVVWLCLVMLAGVLLVLLSAWSTRWVLLAAPLLLGFGGWLSLL